MDEAIIRKRLVTNETFLAQLGPRKLAVEYLALVAALQTKSIDVAEKAYEKLLATLAQYDVNVHKQQLVKDRCEAELQYYAGIHAETTGQVAAAQADIERLKAELQHARVERQQKAVYEERARVVNKHPSREDLAAAIAAVNAEYAVAERERAAVDSKLEYRRAQFDLVFSALDDIGHAMREEEEQERRRAEAAAAETKLAAAQRAGVGAGAVSGLSAPADEGMGMGEEEVIGRDGRGEAEEGGQGGQAGGEVEEEGDGASPGDEAEEGGNGGGGGVADVDMEGEGQAGGGKDTSTQGRVAGSSNGAEAGEEGEL